MWQPCARVFECVNYLLQAILRDPMVSQAIQDLQTDRAAYSKVMRDPAMAAKIQRLVAAGIIGVK